MNLRIKMHLLHKIKSLYATVHMQLDNLLKWNFKKMENQFASYFLKMNSKSTFFLTNTSFEMFKNKAKTFLILNNFLIKIRVKTTICP